MITIIIERVSDWEELREKSGIGKEETFYTVIDGLNSEKNVLMWFMKEGMQYAARCSSPLYPESIKAKVHDSI